MIVWVKKIGVAQYYSYYQNKDEVNDKVITTFLSHQLISVVRVLREFEQNRLHFQLPDSFLVLV